MQESDGMGIESTAVPAMGDLGFDDDISWGAPVDLFDPSARAARLTAIAAMQDEEVTHWKAA